MNKVFLLFAIIFTLSPQVIYAGETIIDCGISRLNYKLDFKSEAVTNIYHKSLQSDRKWIKINNSNIISRTYPEIIFKFNTTKGDRVLIAFEKNTITGDEYPNVYYYNSENGKEVVNSCEFG